MGIRERAWEVTRKTMQALATGWMVERCCEVGKAGESCVTLPCPGPSDDEVVLERMGLINTDLPLAIASQ